MAVLITRGAIVFTICPAIMALEDFRCWISPAMRWEKNSMGRCSTFHI